jgi:hypothetical protein
MPAHPVSAEIPGLIALAMVVSLWTLVNEDLTFFDEPSYMVRGFNGEFTGGASYSDLYAAISLIIKDPVNLYFAGRMAAASVFVVAVWGALRIHTSPRFAWSVAAVAAVVPISHVWPGVANPAAALILLCVSSIIRWPTIRTMSLCVGGVWIAAASRPELVYFALGVTTWACVWVGVETVKHGLRAIYGAAASLAASLVIMLFLFLAHGTPLDFVRSWTAFGQHYGVRAALPGEDTWFQWGQIVQRDFPGATSVAGAIVASPLNFLHHVAANTMDAPSLFVEFVAPDFPLEDPARLLATIMLLAFTAAVVVAILRRPREVARVCSAAIQRDSLRRNRVTIIFVSFALVFSLAPPVVIFPRDHYMLVLIGFSFLLGAAVIWRFGSLNFMTWALVLPQTLMFLAFSGLTVLGVANRSTDPATLVSTVRAIDAEGETLNFMGVPSELGIFTKQLNPVVVEPELRETFAEYLERNHIRAVLVTDQLRFGPWGQLDGIGEFLQNPAGQGFTPAAKGSPVYVR